jgi:hypothetical protein
VNEKGLINFAARESQGVVAGRMPAWFGVEALPLAGAARFVKQRGGSA